jgi:hypothetical protein
MRQPLLWTDPTHPPLCQESLFSFFFPSNKSHYKRVSERVEQLFIQTNTFSKHPMIKERMKYFNHTIEDLQYSIFSISVLCVDLSARLFFYFPQRSASVVSETTAPLFRLLLSQNLVGWSGGRLHVDSLILRTEGSNADRFTSVSKID